MSEDIQLLPYQQRVVEEKAELDAKIDLISSFVGSDAFGALEGHDRTLLRRQYGPMVEYSVALGKRIERFRKAAKLAAAMPANYGGTWT